MNEPLAPVLAEGILCGSIAVVPIFLAAVDLAGASFVSVGRTLPTTVVIACLMLYVVGHVLRVGLVL